MMTSFPDNIPHIAQIIANVNPKTILDVGTGFGKYGLMAREALLSINAERGDIIPNYKAVQVDCAEMCEYFINLPYHDKLYDHHYHGDVRNIDLPKYDLILLIDVAEHWPKEQVVKFIKDNVAKGSMILVSTPIVVGFYTQEFYGKDCPKHITQWSHKDFDEFEGHDVSTKDSYIYLIVP